MRSDPYKLDDGGLPLPLSSQKISYLSAPLYHKGKKGELRVWRCWAVGGSIYSVHGVLSGVLQLASRDCEAKNVGRANETTPAQQAKLEAEAMFKHKLDRKYALSPEDATSGEAMASLPMLATPLKAKKLPSLFPFDAQPKLDGVRCLAPADDDGSVTLGSRSGKPYDIEHIRAAVEALDLPGLELDGEVYVHGMSCQAITSLAKNTKKPERSDLRFWVYDMPRHPAMPDDAPWAVRRSLLEKVLAKASSIIVPVETKKVSDMGELQAFHGDWVSQGYEGSILRLWDAPYIYGYRSAGLIKYKDFFDEEFMIIGFTEGVGAYKGCVLWRCVTAEGKEFDCPMACTVPKRKEYFKRGKEFVGRVLTVRYQNWTDDRIPRFPCGRVFREPEDL